MQLTWPFWRLVPPILELWPGQVQSKAASRHLSREPPSSSKRQWAPGTLPSSGAAPAVQALPTGPVPPPHTHTQPSCPMGEHCLCRGRPGDTLGAGLSLRAGTPPFFSPSCGELPYPARLPSALHGDLRTAHPQPSVLCLAPWGYPGALSLLPSLL